MKNTAKLDALINSTGFIAALDQSGGSTPKALKMYGVNENEYANDEEMFAKVHEMRSRIMTDENFTHDKIMAAILFENTMNAQVCGQSTPSYLWESKGILPILKVDKGLVDEENGVQMMKPNPNLDQLLDRAISKGIFGTKMRSVIKSNHLEGISDLVEQQFAIAKRIIAKGLMPIIEPEIDINASDKSAAEVTLREALLSQLNRLESGQNVIFKLTLPEEANFYKACIDHENVSKVVALSGGYSREEAVRRLSENNGMIASFSRALAEGLSVTMRDEEFSATLGSSIDAIVNASRT